MIDELLQILNTVGQVVDTPWAAVRTGIRDRSFESGLESILDVDRRATGRQMLESLGMGENQPGLDWGDVAGFATEVIPDMILPGAGAYKAIKWLRGADEAAPMGRAFLDAIDKAVPTPTGAQAIPEDQLMRLIGSNPIIEAANEMPLALPAPTPDAAPYYSRLRQAIEALPGENYKSQSVHNQLKRVAPEGFAQQEVEWSKLGELLGQNPMVSKQQLLGHMDEALPTYTPTWARHTANREFANPMTGDDWSDAVRYNNSEYRTGKGAYAEHVAQHPGDPSQLKALKDQWKQYQFDIDSNWAISPELERDATRAAEALNMAILKRADPGEIARLQQEADESLNLLKSWRDERDALHAQQYKLDSDIGNLTKSTTYRSSHWDEKNPLLHLRTETITDDAGRKTLLANEIQSDWHQAGKKRGYIGADEPHHLYGTSEQVANAPFKEDWPLLGLKELLRQGVEQGADEVAWLPGKTVQSMVGGKLAGQEQFYDKDLLNIANKYIKNRGWDTAVNEGVVTSDPFNIPITPQMRSDIRSRGQPLMSVIPLLALLNAFVPDES